MNLKNSAKVFLNHAKEQYHSSEEYRFMRDIVLRDKAAFPPLTAAEKKEIHAYWSHYGFSIQHTDTYRVLYSLTGVHDPRFVPAYLHFDRIIPKLNDSKLISAWEDKAYLSRILYGFPTPRQILANIHGIFYDEDFHLISREAAEEIIHRYPALVFKPTILSGQGRMVNLFRAPYETDVILATYGENFSVQLPISQCAEMASLNPSSVNTFRVNTLVWNGEKFSLPGFMRVGEHGNFADNYGDDRYFIGIQPDGSLGSYVVDHHTHRISLEDVSIPFQGFTIPKYTDAVEMAKAAHDRCPHFGLIGWDFCINENYEPQIIEMNIASAGIFEVQMVSQTPFFGDMTDELLSAIQKRK